MKSATLLFLFLFTFSVFAQSGNIEGVVTDESTGESLAGANVFLKGTALGSASDLEGKFIIHSIPPGKYTLVTGYIGYETKKIEVAITPNRTMKQDVKLAFSVLEMGESVTITAQREGQVAAINQQISSDRIVNIVAEERIQELPDANAAESISRLPGIAVQRDGGEAQKVLIRGLDAKFTTITLNGIQIPATNSENRDVDLSVISQDALVGIEVYKAITADQDADAIAGTVNLVTGKAKEGQNVRLDVLGSYNKMTEAYKQYDISARYSNRYLNNKLGIQASIQAEQRDRSSESAVDGWSITEKSDGTYDHRINSLTLQLTDETRKRYGGELTLDYDTPDGGNIKFINVLSTTSREQGRSSRNYTATENVTYIGQVTDTDIKTLNNSLIGENHFKSLKIDWALAHAYTERETPFDHYMRFYENRTTFSGMRTIGSIDTLKMPGKYLVPYAFNNFDVSTVDRAFFYKSSNDERHYVGKIDLEQPYNLGTKLAGIIKFGYKYRGKVRHRDYDEWMGAYWLRQPYTHYFDENGNIVEKNWASSSWLNGGSNRLTDFLGPKPYQSHDFYEDYTLYPVISSDLVREWYNFNKNGTPPSGHMNEYVYQLSSVRDKYTIEENIHAAYVMTKLNISQFVTFIAGVRYESEHNDYTAKFAPQIKGFLESQTGEVTDTTAVYTKEFWLPNYHLKIKPFKWWDIRLAATKTLSRPDYQMRLPALYISRQDQEIEARNPNLNPAVAWNYDANMSFYSTDWGLLTVSGFYKDIDDIFYWLNDIKIMSSPQADSIGLPVEKYGPFNQYTVDMPVNTQDTRVWGYELEVQTHLWFAPGILKNVVVNANYSRIWSETNYPRFELIQVPGFPPKPPIPHYFLTQRALTGQTDYIGNVAVGYDQAGFSGRLSVYFQGPYLDFVSQTERLDQYRKSFSRWDISLKQRITQNITVFLNLNNITDVLEGNYYLYRELDMGGHRNGMTGDLGLRFTF